MLFNTVSQYLFVDDRCQQIPVNTELLCPLHFLERKIKAEKADVTLERSHRRITGNLCLQIILSAILASLVCKNKVKYRAGAHKRRHSLNLEYSIITVLTILVVPNKTLGSEICKASRKSSIVLLQSCQLRTTKQIS